jgi:lipoate-protein ligase A
MAIRLILDDALDGAWNMAVDEAILRTTAERGSPTLRIYRWSQATLSLGYFQRHDDRREHQPSEPCPVVRRTTGGGAIVHDREFTYSFCTPIADRVAAELRGLYELFHQALIDALRTWCGAEATLVSRQPKAPSRKASDNGAEPFLCFQRRAESDVALDGVKILGSAQRRRHGALLQHGSVLWSRSEFAPELAGIEQLAPGSGAQEDLLRLWLKTLQGRLGDDLVPGGLTASEAALARELLVEIFCDPFWLRRR